jgi:hypothetical protein
MFRLPVAGPNPATVRVTPLLERPPNAAEIVLVPFEMPVANPPEAPEVIVAAAVFEEPHITRDVTLSVVLSEFVPVAVNCSALLAPMEPTAGVIAIETGAG